MHMGMEDVLAAGGSDIPSDRKADGLELIKSAFRLNEHYTEDHSSQLNSNGVST